MKNKILIVLFIGLVLVAVSCALFRETNIKEEQKIETKGFSVH